MEKWMVCIIALLLVSCTSQDSSTIRLGYIGPLTGDAAEYGTDERIAIEIALEEIHETGGVDGKRVEIIYEDGQCSGKAAATAASKLVNVDKVEVILGGGCSGETLAAAPITEQAGVVLLTAFSSNPDVKYAGDYVFRSSVNDKQGGDAIAKIVSKDHKKVAILSEKTSYAEAFDKVFKEQLPKYGGEIISAENFETAEIDLRTQLVKIASHNPDAIVFNTQSGKSGGRAIKQAFELEIPGEYYATFYASSNDFQEIVGDLKEGIKFIDLPLIEKDDIKGTRYLEKFYEKAGRLPSSTFLAGSRYDTVYVIKEAIEAVGYNADEIKDYLYEIEYDGVIATHSYDEWGEPKGIEYVGFEFKDGEIVELPST